ncbi:DUF2059 domain-containing protein [Allosphingosinicella deserti]|uniref:DUF2059 domain-containing protein n=1 Tax=Allosphingosinicella deserti TaxID=2116704 RepID=A0A2P7QM28_9SPHN|nr:DUF2059 domain-containing protein [Sphingomonas deserti]PSJ39004.1 hypothetical protein C7I55_17045 [Sphingomonas deserti]
MLILVGALLQAAAPAPAATPSPEAHDLGVRLARTTGLAAIAPALIEKDLTELASANPALTGAERTQLLEIGRKEGRTSVEKLTEAIGSAYAERLSVADLRLLVAHGESPAAARWRAAEPAVIAQAMGALGELDLKKNAAAAFCRQSGKLCDRD